MRLKEGVGVAFEKAVRRKPLARRTRELCKLNGSSEGCRSLRESSRRVEEKSALLQERRIDARSGPRRGRKKMSGGNGGTLRRDALKRADSAVCG